jgi:hypothetical protein
VTRPGGRVCLVDTDWESLAVDGLPGDLVAAVTAHLHGHGIEHHRSIGRTLRGRLVRAGLVDIAATPVTLLFGDPQSAAMVLPMVDPGLPDRRAFTHIVSSQET